jgi:hypothetical protein
MRRNTSFVIVAFVATIAVFGLIGPAGAGGGAENGASVSCTDDRTVQFVHALLADATVTVTNTFAEEPEAEAEADAAAASPADVVAASPTFTG